MAARSTRTRRTPAKKAPKSARSVPRSAPPAVPAAPPTDVDAYLATLPRDTRNALERLRKSIRAAAPLARETISYRIPSYTHHGMLVGFAAFKDHCGFYVMSPKVMDAFRSDLKGFDTATATIRFPASKVLPATLVRKLVKARVQENEARR